MSASAPRMIDEKDASLSDLLDRAEHGEAITISRHGRPVAQLIPTAPESGDVEEARKAVARLLELPAELARSGVQSCTIEEILALRHEGHKY